MELNMEHVYVDEKDTRVREVARRGMMGLLPGQGADGYGRKITTNREVFIEGKWRRVYVTQFSNAGSAWVMVGKQKKFLLGL